MTDASRPSGTGEPLEVDVAVIGGGVVGAAVARLAAHHRLRVVLIEAGPDVGAGTSKANTAILHTGFDATPGSAESRLVRRGHELLSQHARRVGIAVEETGAVLVAWDDEQVANLPALARKAAANGYGRTYLLDAQELATLEPSLGPGARGGLLVPGEHIIDPWSTPISFALDAIANGARVLRSAPVRSAVVGMDHTLLTTDAGDVAARFVVNAAGLHADRVDRWLTGGSGPAFTVRPRRGELIVFDKAARPLVRRTILPVPTATTKGVLVAPTVFGNVMLGPTAEDVDDRAATGSTAAGIAGLLERGRSILPSLLDEEITAVYAGLRAATEHSDYCLWHDASIRYVRLAGIRSTGLTASMALAEEALERLGACGLELDPKPADEIAHVRLPSLGEAGLRPGADGGRIVCHCERVTEGELTAAVGGPLPAIDLDGVRRRTRALAGRCQGFGCTAQVITAVASASGRDASSWWPLP